MDISFNTLTASVEMLRLLAGFLHQVADHRDGKISPPVTIPPAPVKTPDASPPLPPPAPPPPILQPNPNWADAARSITPPSSNPVPPPPPPVVPPAAGPAAPAATTASPTDRDVAGIPWDARIHSETRKLNKDGTWRARRNLPDGHWDTVMDELRGNLPATSNNVPVSTQPAAVAPNPVLQQAGVLPFPPPSTAGAVPAPPPVAPPSVMVPPPPPGGPAGVLPGAPSMPVAPTFRDLMQRVSAALNAGTITNDAIIEACRLNGAQNLQELITRPELIGGVMNTLSTMGA